MKNQRLPSFIFSLLFFMLSTLTKAQVPVANFTVSPTTICSGTANVVQITDLSTNSPTGWSYTIAAGAGPGSTTFAVQNPTLSFNMPGTYSITLISTNSSGASSAVTHTIRVSASPNANINPAAPTICPGAPPLTINIVSGGPTAGANSYSWSTSATTSSITVSPSVTTTYTCVITSTNGCSVTRTSTVTVSQPTITLTSVPANICPGSSSTITAAASGTGTWNYLWSTGSTNSNISTTLAGVYTATVSNGSGCTGTSTYTLGTSSSLSLTATANQTAICSGGTSFLSVSGANSYTWSNASTLTTIFVSPTVTTSYSVIGELGTCTGTTSINITVSQIPTITVVSSATAVCAGGTISLTANGATNYTWLPASQTTQSITVNPTANTTYTVRGTNPGCTVRTATVNVGILQTPVINVSSSASLVCPGEVAALAASGANTYGWSNAATTAVIIVTPLVSTSYTVTGVGTNGCSAQAVITQNVSECTGIDQLAASSLQSTVYPNPNNGNFVLELDKEATVFIYNAIGKLVYSQKMSAGKNNIDLVTEASGIYFIKSVSGTKEQTLKLIKQ